MRWLLVVWFSGVSPLCSCRCFLFLTSSSSVFRWALSLATGFAGCCSNRSRSHRGNRPDSTHSGLTIAAHIACGQEWIEEIAAVEGGKIVREEFFYYM